MLDTTAPATTNHRRQVLEDLAAHQLELVYQRDFGHHDRAQILSTVAHHTPGIDPIVRAQQWSSFVAAYEVLRDLDGGFWDTPAVLAYANTEDTILDSYDRVRVRDDATLDIDSALDRLFAGHRLALVTA